MRLYAIPTLFALTVLFSTNTAVADNDDQASGIKELQGISIKADKEAPKSLVIVPWHDAEHQQSTSLSSGLVDDSLRAIDQDALQRELRLHELSKSGWHRLTPGTR